MKKVLCDCSNIGKLMCLIGLFVLAPVMVLPWYPQDTQYTMSFLIPGGGSAVLGLLICIFGKRDTECASNWRSSVRRSSLTVLFAWAWGVLIGALPFVIGNQLTMVQALFEAVSG